MSRVKFNEEGVLVNADTGEEFGRVEGNSVVLDSNGAELKSLEEIGVFEPKIPDHLDMTGHEILSDGVSSSEEQVSESSLNNQENEFVSPDESKSESEDSSFEQRISSHSSYCIEKTKYEVTKDSYFVVKFGLFRRDDGRFVPIAFNDVDNVQEAEGHWVKFRMWTYREALSWKSKCLEYNQQSKTQIVNNDRLNEMKLKNLLLDWSFGEFEERLHLLHCDGRLSDESYSLFMGLYPSIASTIVDLMNSVLERNQ